MSIDVRHVSKLYDRQKALDDVSFHVKPGEIVGFLGPNGAGKSTMMKIISGYLPQSSGEVYVCGKNVNTEEMAAKRSIGYLPENNPLYGDMYVKEYLTFSGGLYKLKNLKSRVDEVVEQVGLDREKRKKIGALSKGYRQRVGLGQAFLHNPDVLILDEPTTGLDPNQIQEIRHLIKDIGKDKTVMLSTHIMQEVEAICDRAVIIHEGRIVADHSIDALKYSGSHTSAMIVEFKTTDGIDKFKDAFRDQTVRFVSDRLVELKADQLADLKKQVMQFAVTNNMEIIRLSEETKNLEAVFRDLTMQQKQVE